ncbi:MAG: hypothetical protein Q9M36_09155 [Sulfurovum sp.]|nr:hypothetical protein [Sulfurovum sp.]
MAGICSSVPLTSRRFCASMRSTIVVLLWSAKYFPPLMPFPWALSVV